MIEDDLPAGDPIDGLAGWFEEARAAGIPLPGAVCLATASSSGHPSARMVLFRGLHAGRLVFYTDYRSRKAADLQANPRASMVFYWQPLGRQVRVEGTTERLDPGNSDRYFHSRSRESRISAWTSKQSAVVASREQLERRRAAVEKRFRGREVPRPAFWGGFALTPLRVEFWRERPSRFHDRVVFERCGNGWSRKRLQP